MNLRSFLFWITLILFVSRLSRSFSFISLLSRLFFFYCCSSYHRTQFYQRYSRLFVFRLFSFFFFHLVLNFYYFNFRNVPFPSVYSCTSYLKATLCHYSQIYRSASAKIRSLKYVLLWMYLRSAVLCN